MNKDILLPSKVLLFFYLSISTGFASELLGKQFREFLHENRVAKHILGFMLMLVLINIIGNVYKIDKLLLYSIILYATFILTTKLDIQWNLIVIMILILGYFYENYLISKNVDLEDDNIIDKEEKMNIANQNNNLMTCTLIPIIIIAVIGTALYARKKTVQYGGGEFNPFTYLFF